MPTRTSTIPKSTLALARSVIAPYQCEPVGADHRAARGWGGGNNKRTTTSCAARCDTSPHLAARSVIAHHYTYICLDGNESDEKMGCRAKAFFCGVGVYSLANGTAFW